jgi:CyaY protein
MIDEQEFRKHADETLSRLYRSLNDASDDYAFEADFNAGALTVEFEEPPAKFVISPNTPVRQIWVSAHSKSYKLDWEPSEAAFVLPDTGQTLQILMEEAIGRQLGQEVSL